MRSNRDKPLPPPGWWRGLSNLREFHGKLEDLERVEYDARELSFTHDLVVDGLVDGEGLLLEEIVDGPPWLARKYEGFMISHFLPPLREILAGPPWLVRKYEHLTMADFRSPRVISSHPWVASYSAIPRSRKYELRPRSDCKRSQQG